VLLVKVEAAANSADVNRVKGFGDFDFRAREVCREDV